MLEKFYVIHVDSDIGTVTMDGESVYRGGYRGDWQIQGALAAKALSRRIENRRKLANFLQ